MVITFKAKTVWRPGSARTRWRAHSTPPDPYLDFKGARRRAGK